MVNVVDPDLAVITNIGLDHTDWLGDTVEKIAFEKAGIIRPNIPVILLVYSHCHRLFKIKSMNVRRNFMWQSVIIFINIPMISL